MLQLGALSSAPSQGMESHSSQHAALCSQWRQLWVLPAGMDTAASGSEEVQCFPFVSGSCCCGLGSCWIWLPHPGASQCAAGWDQRCGRGVGSSLSGAGTYQRLPVPSRTPALMCWGGRGRSANLLSCPRTQQWNRGELSRKSELAVPSACAEAPRKAQQCRLGPSCAQHQCLVCCNGNGKGLGFFYRGSFHAETLWVVLVLCCLLGLRGVGRLVCWGNSVESHSVISIH